MTTFSKDERDEMLARMRFASRTFYRLAQVAGCHPFLEFSGLLNEYIQICQAAHEQGIDFTETSAHGSASLQMKPHHVAYLSEKLGCIYGNSARDLLIGKLCESEREPATVIHILDGGRPLCCFSDLVPGKWPPGHVWISLADWQADDQDEGDCPGCCAIARLWAMNPPSEEAKRMARELGTTVQPWTEKKGD